MSKNNFVIECQDDACRRAVVNMLGRTVYQLESMVESEVQGTGEGVDAYVELVGNPGEEKLIVSSNPERKGIVLVDEEGELASVKYEDALDGEFYISTIRGSLWIYQKNEKGVDIKFGQAGSLDVALDKLVEINEDAEKIDVIKKETEDVKQLSIED